MEEKSVLMVKDIAVIMGIQRNTIQSKRWQAQSKCPLIKRGKRLYVISGEFWNWFKNGTAGVSF